MSQLTTDPAPDWFPRWSPDGEEIAFYAYRSGNRDLWVMPSEGGPARQLTSHPALDVGPRWSPDGREIAFTSRRRGNRDVWIVDAEGGEPRQVTVDLADETIVDWSPDGRWLAFASRRRLFRIPAAGGEPERLGERLFGSWGARLSPDGKVLYYLGQDDNVWALSLEDGSESAVTDLAGRRGTFGWSVATDGHYLLFHLVGTDRGSLGDGRRRPRQLNSVDPETGSRSTVEGHIPKGVSNIDERTGARHQFAGARIARSEVVLRTPILRL